MFRDAQSFNSDLSEWDVSRVTTMNSMFSGAWQFNSDLSRWNVSKVMGMEYMFMDARSFRGDLSKWKVSEDASTNLMFKGASCSVCDHVPLTPWLKGFGLCHHDCLHSSLTVAADHAPTLPQVLV